MDKREFKYSDADLLAAARKYQTRGQWQKEGRRTYQAARKRLVWEECITHMVPSFKSCYIVYAYEFRDRHCYVGLTCQPRYRAQWHSSHGPVRKHKWSCAEVVYKVLESNLEPAQAAEAEQKWQEYYRLDGWTALHKRAGSLGGWREWTKTRVTWEAGKFGSCDEWRMKSPRSYLVAEQNGWLEEIWACLDKIYVPQWARPPGFKRQLAMQRQWKFRQMLSLPVECPARAELWSVVDGSIMVSKID